MALGVNIVSDFDAKGINKAISDFKKLKTNADKAAFGLKTSTSAVNNGVKNFAKFAGAGALVAGVIGKNLVNAGSDLEESISKVRVVFGESAKVVEDFAKKAASSMGISNQQALEAAGTYGNLLQAFGTTREKATEMSTTMVQLAGDLASFNNVPIGEALNAIRSGLSGEAEPLKRFGVAINDVRLKEEALRLGLYAGKGQLSVLAKSQAAYSLILKDTALAQGDYGRTSDGVANRQRTLTATFEDIKAKLGTGLLPIYKSILSYTQEKLMPAFEEFTKIMGEDGLGGAFKYLGGKALDAIGSLKGWGTLIYGIVTAVIALNVATGIYNALSIVSTIVTAAFGVTLNAAFMGIPALIGLVIVVFVALLLKFKALRDVAIPVLKTVANAFLAVFVNPIINAINVLITAWNLLPFHKDVAKIDEFNISMDKTAKKVETVGQEMAKLKGGLKLGQASVPLPKVKPTGGGGGGGGTVDTTGIDKLKAKLKTYSDLVVKTTGFQKDLKDALKVTKSANDDLTKATENVTKAQEEFNKISQGYGAGSGEAKTAQEELSQAQRDATRAGFDLEEANFAVTDAEKALNEARATGTAQEIRQAEIDLAEAKMTVTEKTIALTTATTNAATAQANLNGTVSGFPAESTKYKDALTLLKEAQQEQVDATDRVNDAKQRELETTNKLIAANKELARKKMGITKKEAKSIAKGLKNAGITVTQDMFDVLGITPFAEGGIVRSPVNALIGEAGPEAIIPLDQYNKINKMGNMGSGMNITINTGVGDPVAIGKAVVSSLQAYEKRFGNLPIKVA
jgi:hypothetical protein